MTGDDFISPLDALWVINYLNRGGGGGLSPTGGGGGGTDGGGGEGEASGNLSDGSSDSVSGNRDAGTYPVATIAPAIPSPFDDPSFASGTGLPTSQLGRYGRQDLDIVTPGLDPIELAGEVRLFADFMTPDRLGAPPISIKFRPAHQRGTETRRGGEFAV